MGHLSRSSVAHRKGEEAEERRGDGKKEGDETKEVGERTKRLNAL